MPEKVALPTGFAPMYADAAQWRPGAGDDLVLCLRGREGLWVYVSQGPTRSLRKVAQGWGATWSPDGSQIAYLTAREYGHLTLRTLDLHAGQVRVVANFPYGVTRLYWAPNGDFVAGGVTVVRFGSDGFPVSQSHHIDMVDVRDGTATHVVRLGSRHLCGGFAWSHQGTRFAYPEWGRDSGKLAIYMRVKGTGPFQSWLLRTRVFAHLDADWSANWFSRDGRRLWCVAAMPRRAGHPRTRVECREIETGRLVRFIDTDDEPLWATVSASERYLAYLRLTPQTGYLPQGDVVVWDLETMHAVWEFSAEPAWAPAWNSDPDSEKLAFMTEKNLCIVAAEAWNTG